MNRAGNQSKDHRWWKRSAKYFVPSPCRTTLNHSTHDAAQQHNRADAVTGRHFYFVLVARAAHRARYASLVLPEAKRGHQREIQ